MKNEEYTYLGGLMQGIGSLLTGMKTTIKVYFRKKVTEQYPENRAELKMFDNNLLTMPKWLVYWKDIQRQITHFQIETMI